MIDPLIQDEEWLEATFPTNGPPAEQLQFLIQYAILAPSAYNSQPWRFHVAGETLEVYADRSRQIPVLDPAGRLLTLSCGAAIFYLRLAIAHFGYRASVVTLPDAAAPDLLAHVRLGEPGQATAAEDFLFQSIRERHTNRQPFEHWRPGESLLMALKAAALSEGAWLQYLADAALREAVSGLTVEGERILWADPEFRRALARWVRPNYEFALDGIAGASLGLGDMVSSLAPFVVRTLDLGTDQALRDRQLLGASPVLLVLGTHADDPTSWLEAGQALARVLLRAGGDGVSASFLNQAILVPDLRARLAGLLGSGPEPHTGWPQVLLRLGYGPPVPGTARRPAAAVTL